MKLTKQIKENIFNAILSDLPQEIDYKDQIQAKIWEYSINQLPIEIKSAVSVNPDVKTFLSVESMYLHDCNCMRVRSYKGYKLTDDEAKEVNRLHDLFETQRNNRNEIKNSLWGIVDSCTTSNQLETNYPEFANYIPKQEQPIRNLPAVNLLEKMTEMGWAKK